MATSEFLPPTLVAHTFAQLLDGRTLNGTNPATVAIPWRSILTVLANTEPAQRARVFESELIRLGITVAELAAVNRLIREMDPASEKPSPTSEAARLGIRILNAEQIDQEPDPVWLVAGHIPLGELMVLYGMPSSGKSFVGLDLAVRIALGRPWFGYEVRQGPVVYIAGEGTKGLKLRLRSWYQHFNEGQRAKDFYLVPASVNIADEHAGAVLASLITTVVPLRPQLIVVDTLARNMYGDENSTNDMNNFMRGIGRLQAATGATILIIHHTTKGGETIRGSSILPGEVATMVHQALDEESGVITLTCKKQRDGDYFDKRRFVLMKVDKSCVLGLTAGSVEDELPPLARQVLEYIASKAGTHFGAIRHALEIVPDSGQSKALQRTLQDCTSAGFILARGERPKTVYTITQHGRDKLAPSTGLAEVDEDGNF